MLQPKPRELYPQVTPELLAKLTGTCATRACVAPTEITPSDLARRERLLNAFKGIITMGGTDVVRDHTKFLPGADVEETSVLDVDLGEYKARLRQHTGNHFKTTLFRREDDREYFVTSVELDDKARFNVNTIERAEEAHALLFAAMQSVQRMVYAPEV